MKWASAISESENVEEAVSECAESIKSIVGNSPDLVFVFPSFNFSGQFKDISNALSKHFENSVIMGCSGNGVIGAGREVEHTPGFAMCAAELPEVEITPFHISDSDLPDGDDPPNKWENVLGVSRESRPNFVLLADPFSVRGENLLMGMDYAYPDCKIVGGLASGGTQPGSNALYLNNITYDHGIAGVALSGNIEINTIVAQGCKPIGSLSRITKCERNILQELDGRSPFDILGETYNDLNEADQKLFQNSLFLGVVMDPFESSPGIGDFLIRNIVGANPDAGQLAVGQMLREGQLVQFHLRDAQTSTENLSNMLDEYQSTSFGPETGALMFSCLGRGKYLYEEPDHDTDLFREKIGDLPLTGFFCNGEIGPVSGSTFLHGYTSSFGIFKPQS
jgi:small ligand-binding sensory domain FIST|tara:strand:+ start:2025 stop:3203 length:1179 start_codon:yes stop_codon:yes gene_type:complete